MSYDILIPEFKAETAGKKRAKVLEHSGKMLHMKDRYIYEAIRRVMLLDPSR